MLTKSPNRIHRFSGFQWIRKVFMNAKGLEFSLQRSNILMGRRMEKAISGKEYIISTVWGRGVKKTCWAGRGRWKGGD